jgi:hypothetical protein
MSKCKYFSIKELVSPAVFKRYGEDAWAFLDERLCVTLDAIRARFGATVVNDWSWGGSFRYRGLRAAVDYPELKRQGIYLRNSYHNKGKACDMHFRNISVNEARKYILQHPAEFPFVKGVEIAPWLHIDVRESDKVIIFNR